MRLSGLSRCSPGRRSSRCPKCTSPHPESILVFRSVANILPVALSPGHEQSAFFWEMGVGILVLAGIFLLYKRRHFPAADWGVWALVSILPFLNNSPNRLAFGPSRQLYFASIGSSLVFIWAFRHLIQNADRLPQKAKQLAFLSLLLLITTCSVISLKRAEALSLILCRQRIRFSTRYRDGITPI